MNSEVCDAGISRNTNLKIYKSIVQSIVTRGTELLVICKKDAPKTQTMEVNYWRRCCQLMRTDRIRKSEIRRCVGNNTDIIETIVA